MFTMRTSAIVLAALPLLALADSHYVNTAWRHSRRAAKVVPRGQAYKLEDMYKGQTFLDGWDFFTGPDPTHGLVRYVNAEEAAASKLAFVQADNTTVLAVDDTNRVAVGSNRNSVRISSKKKYNGGLFIADFWSTPHGCSTWPAWWSVGPNWPNGGEIDVVEATHNSNHNAVALHTGPGCTMNKDPRPLKTSAAPAVAGQVKAFTGQITNTKCPSSGGDNSGCGFLDTDARSFGEGFNRQAGGVFAHQWNSQGIAIWFFSRNEIPQDIQSGNPDPSTWPTPMALWSADTCDMASNFYDHTLVLDITMCGDFAGATYANSGCPGTCAEAVADPNNFKFAKFKINYIAVYQPS